MVARRRLAFDESADVGDQRLGQLLSRVERHGVLMSVHPGCRTHTEVHVRLPVVEGEEGHRHPADRIRRLHREDVVGDSDQRELLGLVVGEFGDIPGRLEW